MGRWMLCLNMKGHMHTLHVQSPVWNDADANSIVTRSLIRFFLPFEQHYKGAFSCLSTAK